MSAAGLTTGRGGRLGRASAWVLRRLHSAGTRFPVAVLLVVAFSALSNAAIRERFDDATLLLRLLSAIGAGAALSVAAALVAEGRLREPAARLAVAALAAAAAAAAVWFSHPFSLYGPILTFVSLAAIPVFGSARRGGPHEFWTFALWTLVGVALAFLSVLLFAAGAYAILEMARYLFRVELLRRFDSHLWTTALTLVGPLFALGRIPPTDRAALVFDPDERLVRAVRPLFEWVLAPLVLAAALVLHIYIIRIVATGEVPAGQIGWIVAVYLLFVIGLRIAIDPFEMAGQTAPSRWFREIWAAIAVAPLLLLAHALRLRLLSEGVTVDRYYLMLWLAAGVLVVLAQIPRRLRGDIRVLAIIPPVLLLASTIGPLGVADMVARSQTARIVQAFGGILAASEEARPVVPGNEVAVLRSRLRALERVGKLGAVAALLPLDRRNGPLWREGSLTVDAVAAALVIEQPFVSRDRSLRGSTADALDIGGFDRAATSISASIGIGRSDAAFRLSLHGNRLGIVVEGVGDEVDLSPFLADFPWREEAGNLYEVIGSARVLDVTTRSGRGVRLRIEQASVDPQTVLTQFSATVLWRAAEWSAGPSPTPPR